MASHRKARAGRTRRACVAVLLWLVCGGATCEPGHEARLLSVSALEPTQVSVDTPLLVRGEGFPTGHDAALSLRGRVHRPGQRPETIDAQLTGRAIAADRVQLPVDAEVMRALGQAGSFAGTLTLSFDGADPGTRVTGSLPVAFDLAAPTLQGLRRRPALQRRARKLLDFLGIVPAAGASTQDGLPIGETRPGSPAHAAGLSQGDVIVRAAGVGVHSLGDLAPPPDPDTWSCEVLRPGRASPVALQLSVAGFEAPTLSTHLRPLCLLAGGLLLCLLTIGPLPSLAVWLARCRSRLAGEPATLAWTRIWDDRPPAPGAHVTGLRARLSGLCLLHLLPITVTALLFGGALLHPMHSLRFNSLHIYLGLTVLSVGLTLSLSSALSSRQRAAHARTQLGRMAVVGLAIGCACALGGTRSLSGIIGSQGGTPVRWLLFSQPAMFVIFPAFIMHGSRVVPLELGEGTRAHATAFMLDVGGRVLLGAIGAAIFLGGYQTTGIPHADRVDPHLLGAALFTLKAWGIGVLMHLRRTMGRPRQQAWRLSLVSSLLAIALTATWVQLGVSDELTLATGYVLAFASGAALLTALLRVVRSAEPMGSPPRYAVAE